MATLKIFSPFDNSIVGEIPLQGEKETEFAISRARNLFDNRKLRIPAYERIEILEKAAKIMFDKKEELTITATNEGGKPYLDSLVEVERAISGVKLAATYIGRMHGSEIPMGHTKSSVNRLAFTINEPIGVVASISAFNHPLNLIIHQTIPALAVGAPVIIKPALSTPLSCLKFGEILQEAGLPEGWCQTLICEDKFAEKLATDKRINYLSFIGSAKTGWYLRSKLAAGTRCALEHGGVAPVIVEKDADLDQMIPALTKGAFYHAGQVCVSVQRVFINEEIFNKVANLLQQEANKLIVGDPLKKTTDIGPLILEREVDRVEKWVNEAIAEGGELLYGGKRISKSCYQPTILLNPSFESKVSTMEVFGPVVCLYSYKNRDEAVSKANSLPYAFQAAVFSKDIDNALDLVKKLNASTVMVNDHTAFRVDWMPFGGLNESGLGLGGIEQSMDDLNNKKLIVIKSKSL